MPRLPLTRHLSAVALAALAATLVVAGCGGGDDNGGGSSKKSKASAPASKPASGGAAVTLKATDFKFAPAAPTAKKGTVSFTIKNDGGTTHALEVEGPKGEAKTGNVSPGQSKTIKANLPAGKYEFYCPVDGHKKLGMKGEVTVK
jgi:uncharacterized cupredoxin-like copper-binding protein